MEDNIWQVIKSHFTSFLLNTGPKIVYAIIGFIIGVILIKICMRFLRRILIKSKVEQSLKSFVLSLSVFLLYATLIFVCGLIIGIQASSFLAIFGAAGIAVGLALQGSLANFAGGVLILVFKPFRVDDIVYINGNLGTIQGINILYTHLKTFDGRIITIPNGSLSNDEVDNRSKEEFRRVEVKFNFNFEEDFDRIRKVISQAMEKHDLVVIDKDKPIQVWLNDIGEYDMKVSARCWVESPYYWDLYWAQMEAVKKAIEKEGIQFSIPKKALYYPESSTSEAQEHG